MATQLESFDQSPLDAFIRSDLLSRGLPEIEKPDVINYVASFHGVENTTTATGTYDPNFWRTPELNTWVKALVIGGATGGPRYKHIVSGADQKYQVSIRGLGINYTFDIDTIAVRIVATIIGYSWKPSAEIWTTDNNLPDTFSGQVIGQVGNIATKLIGSIGGMANAETLDVDLTEFLPDNPSLPWFIWPYPNIRLATPTIPAESEVAFTPTGFIVNGILI